MPPAGLSEDCQKDAVARELVQGGDWLLASLLANHRVSYFKVPSGRLESSASNRFLDFSLLLLFYSLRKFGIQWNKGIICSGS